MTSQREWLLREAHFEAVTARIAAIVATALTIAAPVGAIVERSLVPLLLWAFAWLLFLMCGINLLHKDRYEALASAADTAAN